MPRKTTTKSDDEAIEFEATIPLLQSAIQIDGNGGVRIKLDIPEECMGAALPLLAMRGKVLLVSVRVLQSITESDKNGGTETNKRTTRNPLGMAGG